MAILHFVYPSISDGHLLCFQFGAIMNNSDKNICVRVFVLTNPPTVNQPHKTLKEKSYNYNKIIKFCFIIIFGFFQDSTIFTPNNTKACHDRKTGIITESKSKTESEEVRCSLRSLLTLSQQHITTYYFSMNRRVKKDQDIP